MNRYLLTLLILVLSGVCAYAQQNSIEIDASSFAAVQTDMISGVAIDKIGKDHSNRECARIKMRINRMTATEIGELSVRPRGGNVEVMKCAVAAEGNGLIIELTAKEPTTFYITHPKYGDSNEVSLNLEGGKEYKINAELQYLQPIVVESNVAGADVYIDNEYKGQTNENFKLTVSDIMRGEHNLRVVHGALESVQTISVTGSDIHFRANINQEGEKSHWVVFKVTPENAWLEIDNENIDLTSEGVAQKRMRNGAYSYMVSAKDYHTEFGEFTVKDNKLEKSITLKPAFGWLNIESSGDLAGAEVYVDDERIGTTPIKSYKLASGTHNVRISKQMFKSYKATVLIEDNTPLNYNPTLEPNFANVTITTDSGALIYIDEIYKGIGTWSGQLEAGSHVIEARKNGHRTTLREVVIIPEDGSQSYTLPDPKPIYGSLTVTSTPPLATVLVDGKTIGQTPITEDVIIGKHNVTVKRDGYNSQSIAVTIEEGKEVAKHVDLAVKTTTSTTTTSSTANKANVMIAYNYSSAEVYVDGNYVGTANKSYWLNYGVRYIIVKSQGYYYGMYANIDSSSKHVLMYNAPKIYNPQLNVKPQSSTSITPKKNYSSKSKHTSNRKKIEGFNIGISLGGSIAIPEEDDYESEVEGEFNLGLAWRLWRHSSTFNVNTGIQYMRTRGINFLTFPAVLNWNFLRDDSWGGIYVGMGTEISLMFDPLAKEYYGKSFIGTAYPYVIQMGLGFRHFDTSLYWKIYSFERYYTTMDILSTVGLRCTYYF